MKLNAKRLKEKRLERETIEIELQRNIVYVHTVGVIQMCVISIGRSFRKRYYVMQKGRRWYLIVKSSAFVTYHAAVEHMLQAMGVSESIKAFPCGIES